MKHKAQFTTPQLVKQQLGGMDVFPVFGRYMNMQPAQHLPRSKFDPKPWVVGGKGGFRYSAYELTAERHVTTDTDRMVQRHLVEDTTDFIRANLVAC